MIFEPKWGFVGILLTLLHNFEAFALTLKCDFHLMRLLTFHFTCDKLFICTVILDLAWIRFVITFFENQMSILQLVICFKYNQDALIVLSSSCPSALPLDLVL